MNKQFPYWLLTISVVLGLTLPVLIQDGMFPDALLYTCVSHNLSMGIGTFWFPQYSKLNIAGLSSFHEQPPLLFGIQSLFFRALGHSIYVERFYVLLTIMLNVLLIRLLWKECFKEDDKQRELSWLPVLFWILVPVCFWSYRSNMIENTMSVFDLTAVLLFLYSQRQQRYRLLLMFGSGLFIFMASFTKGLPGLFPLALPFIFWLAGRRINFKKCLLYSVILLIIPALVYFILFSVPHSRESLSIYLFSRVFVRIGAESNADFRLDVFWRLFTELLPPLIITTFVIVYQKIKKIENLPAPNTRQISLFLLLGLSASAPLVLTLVQKGWYLVTSFPYWVIGLALIISPVVANITERIGSKQFKVLGSFSVFLLAAVLVFSGLQFGKVSRKQDVVADVYKIGGFVPRFSTIGIPVEMYDEFDFMLQGSLIRHFNISIDPYHSYDFYLKEKSLNTKVPEAYERLDLHLERYDLYRKKKNGSISAI